MMAIVSGASVFYVNSKGQIESVAATSDEQNGVVSVKHEDGRISAINTFNIFNTDVAANIAAQNRRSIFVKNAVEYPKFYRDPAKYHG